MRRRRFLKIALASLAAAIALPAARGAEHRGKHKDSGKGPGNRDGVDNVVGWRWEYRMYTGQDDEKGETMDEGHFRVANHEIFKGPNKVGFVKPKSETETTLVFTDSKLKGRAILRKTGKHPPVWQGILRKEDGTEWKIKVKVVDK